jgi:hypothetical protein
MGDAQIDTAGGPHLAELEVTKRNRSAIGGRHDRVYAEFAEQCVITIADERISTTSSGSCEGVWRRR